MRIGWAILAGLLLGGGLYWSFGRAPAPASHASKPPEGRTPLAQGPSLYRWHDAAGILHITDAPPPRGMRFERIPVDLDHAPPALPAR